MNVSKTFKDFTDNLKISNRDDISTKYNNITEKLNKTYWDIDSTTSHSLQVGSYGRNTAINGISDLDMLFQLPKEIYDKYNAYKSNGQSALLQDIKNTIIEKYPNSDVSGNGQVVVVNFTSVKVEILPAFLMTDDSYTFPDSNDGGSWKITKPKEEIKAINDLDKECNYNLKRLCKMIRAWKNKIGLNIGGLLIDTFCYNFLKSTDDFNDRSFTYYDWIVRDFFEFMSELDKDQKYWLAPGSSQFVYKKDNFITKAKKAYEKSLEAIEKNENKTVYELWREIFGTSFPFYKEEAKSVILEKSALFGEVNYTEEFIEELYPVDICHTLLIDCEVTQDGYRPALLRNLKILINKKNLKFFVINNSVNKPYEVKWKVRNVGDEALKKNCIRGQIINDKGEEFKKETSTFNGEHFVECYIIKNNICVARDRIDVPISFLK